MMFSDQRFAENTFDESEARQDMALRRWRAVVQCLAGSTALAFLTAVCFRLRINLATTVCLYLIVVVLLSLQGSFLSSTVVSLIAVACLDYYFTRPIVSFRVSDPFEVVSLIVFLTTSTVVTHFLSRARKRAEEALQRSESYLAEAQRLTHTGSWVWGRRLIFS